MLSRSMTLLENRETRDFPARGFDANPLRFRSGEALTTMSPQRVRKGGLTHTSNRPGRLSSGFQWKLTPLLNRRRFLLQRSERIAFCEDGAGACVAPIGGWFRARIR